LFESLAWHQWQSNDARDPCHHCSSDPHVLCSFCQSFDYDVHSCPYYDISDECHARLSAMIGKMHEQHTRFVSEMKQCGLLHEIDPNLASPRLEVSLYEDCESFLPLELSFVDDIPYTDLEEAPDPPLISSSLVAPSSTSTSIGTTVSALTLHASPLSLAQYMGLEMGEPYRGDVTILEGDFPT